MAKITRMQMNVLVERLGLSLSTDEQQWLRQCFNGYDDQLQALHALQLTDEEVGVAFLDPRGLKHEC